MNGQKVTSYVAYVDGGFPADPDKEIVKTTASGVKYIAESEYRSAPSFGLGIDGITLLN